MAYPEDSSVARTASLRWQRWLVERLRQGPTSVLWAEALVARLGRTAGADRWTGQHRLAIAPPTLQWLSRSSKRWGPREGRGFRLVTPEPGQELLLRSSQAAGRRLDTILAWPAAAAETGGQLASQGPVSGVVFGANPAWLQELLLRSSQAAGRRFDTILAWAAVASETGGQRASQGPVPGVVLGGRPAWSIAFGRPSRPDLDAPSRSKREARPKERDLISVLPPRLSRGLQAIAATLPPVAIETRFSLYGTQSSRSGTLPRPPALQRLGAQAPARRSAADATLALVSSAQRPRLAATTLATQSSVVNRTDTGLTSPPRRSEASERTPATALARAYGAVVDASRLGVGTALRFTPEAHEPGPAGHSEVPALPPSGTYEHSSDLRATLVRIGRLATAEPGSTGPSEASASPAIADHERGVDLHATLVLPDRLAAHGLGWLATASHGVRLHLGERADRVARHLDADAVTVGQAIFARRGRLDLATPRGLALLAHELVHVDQQRRVGGAALAVSGPAGQHHELEALTVERQVLGLLQPSRAHAALPLPRASEGARWAGPGELPPPNQPSSGPFRAAEDRPVEIAEASAPAADPGDMTDQVFRLLQRRLRIERERFVLGRA